VIGPEKDEPMEVLVKLTSHWVTFREPLSIIKNNLRLQKKSVIGLEKDEPMEISVTLTSYWVSIKNPLIMMKNI